MNHLERSYTIAVVAILAALLGVLFVDMAGASEHSPNHPDYWGSDCSKDENFPYETDSWISDGNYVLVVLKAGQDRFVFENVTVGQVLTTGNGKAISHVIFCKEVPPSTTTTVPDTTTTTMFTTTSTTTPTTVPASTTTQPTTTTTQPDTTSTAPTTTVSPPTSTTKPPSTTTTSTVSTTTTSSSVPPTTPTTEPHEDSPVLPDTGGGEQTLMFVVALLSLIGGAGVVGWARR